MQQILVTNLLNSGINRLADLYAAGYFVWPGMIPELVIAAKMGENMQDVNMGDLKRYMMTQLYSTFCISLAKALMVSWGELLGRDYGIVSYTVNAVYPHMLDYKNLFESVVEHVTDMLTVPFI